MSDGEWEEAVMCGGEVTFITRRMGDEFARALSPEKTKDGDVKSMSKDTEWVLLD